MEDNMEIDPDSEDLILKDMDDSWGEDFIEAEEPFKLHIHQIPFVNCDSPNYKNEHFSTGRVESFEIFGYTFDDFEGNN